jgi:hypothetical protein
MGFEGAGEVRTPVLGTAADRLGPGERFWLRHVKAGELAERLTEYHQIDLDAAGTPGVPVCRGEGQCLDEAIAAGPRTSISLPSALAEPTAPVKASWALPAAADRAKDLGLINIAYSLLLVVASLVAGVVLGLMNSHRALSALVGLVTVIAGITVTRVRSVPWPPIPNRYEAAY